jgi:hypothetical protein
MLLLLGQRLEIARRVWPDKAGADAWIGDQGHLAQTVQEELDGRPVASVTEAERDRIRELALEYVEQKPGT